VGEFRNKSPGRTPSDIRSTIKKGFRCEVKVKITLFTHIVRRINGTTQYHIICFTFLSLVSLVTLVTLIAFFSLITLITFCSQNTFSTSPSRTAFWTKQHIGIGVDVEIAYTPLFGSGVCIAI